VIINFLKYCWDRVILIGLLLVLFSVAEFLNPNSKEAKSPSDLAHIQGQFSDYQVIRRGKGESHDIHLVNFNNDFRVAIDDLDVFNQVKFNNSVRVGDIITLSIPHSSLKELGNNKFILILGIKDGHMVYMNENEAINKERKSSFWVASFALIGGLITIIFRSLFLRYASSPTNT